MFPGLPERMFRVHFDYISLCYAGHSYREPKCACLALATYHHLDSPSKEESALKRYANGET